MASPQETSVGQAGDISSTSGASSTTPPLTMYSTPASTVDPSSDEKADAILCEENLTGEGNEGPETPRETHTASIEKKVEELQAKLAEFEEQHESDLRERATLERRLKEEILPFAAPPMAEYQMRAMEERMMKRLVHRPRLFYPYSPDLSEDEGPSEYLSQAISSYKAGLQRLRKEQERIADVYNEREQLESLRHRWSEEREELLAEQERLLSALKSSSGPVGQREDADPERLPEGDLDAGQNAERADAPAPIPVYETPSLNFLDWAAFTATPSITARASYAIDVLNGEPVLTFRNPTLRHLHFLLDSEKLAKPRMHVPKQQPKPVSYDGTSPLPERIRINSAHIQKILEGIDKEAFCGDGPWTMIRPYKALVYYAEPIRRKLEELKKRYAPTVSNLDCPENHAPSDQIETEDITTESVQETGNDEKDEKTNGGEDELTSSPTALQHLDCLVEFLTDYVFKKMAYLATDHPRTVSFADMWYLFRPGEEVIEQSRRQAYRIINMTSPAHRVLAPWERNWGKEGESQDAISIHCVHVDFDGKELGPVSKELKIDRFEGEKAITSLPVFPLRFADSKKPVEPSKGPSISSTPATATLREQLISRGRKFLDVTTFKHMFYSGVTLESREEIDSHVVVDFVEAYSAKIQDNWRPQLEYLIGSTPKEAEDGRCSADCCRNQGNILSDSFVDKKRNEEYMALLVPDDRRKEPSPVICPRPLEDITGQAGSLSEDDLVVLSARVCGFVLHSRKWEKLDPKLLKPPKRPANSNTANKPLVDEGKDDPSPVRDPAGNQPEPKKLRFLDQNAFEQLVLPEGHKDMVRSLIAQHLMDKEAAKDGSKPSRQVDIVQGKGKGLIILLHGAPGVGKTSTAEGVAQMFEMPLYQITCGDLGTKAAEVENELEKHFTLASRWGCVLLLDEADVFLASRSREDYVRNGLVSVFLRVLEYYSGILFLTTNRVGDFDEAFTSRIHISLHYPQLNWGSTEAIFELNLGRIEERFDIDKRKIKVDKPEIIAFAKQYFIDHKKERWNGRQIRNACQTALALAEFRAQGGNHKRTGKLDKEVHLTVEDIRRVTKAYLEFIKYLKDVYGENADRRARRQKIRGMETERGTREKSPAESEEETEPSATDATTKHSDHTNTIPQASQQTTTTPNSQPQQPPAPSSSISTAPPPAPPTSVTTAAPPAGQPTGYNPPPGFPPNFQYPYPMTYGQPPAFPGASYGAPPPAGPPAVPGWTQEAIAAYYQQQQAAAHQHGVPAMPPNTAPNPAS